MKTDEQVQLETELRFINNSSEIKTALGNAISVLDSEKYSLISQLNILQSELSNVSKVFPDIDELLNRVKSAQIELKDINSEIQHLEESLNFDPSRLEFLEDRLDLIYGLQKKHHVNSIEDLLNVHADLDIKINNISNLEESIIKLEQDTDKLRDQMLKNAHSIRKKRLKAVPSAEARITKLLSELGMKHAQLKIDVKPLADDEVRINGSESVNFLFSANKGIDFKELNKVASGGELSRLMLSIKTLIADFVSLPTIIFDEIDTGVSGEIAHKAGNLIKTISNERQVITITHLPQMAGKGDHHLLVYKDSEGKSSKTQIRKLTAEERVEEIAKMLSGDKPSKSAIANAIELLQV